MYCTCEIWEALNCRTVYGTASFIHFSPVHSNATNEPSYRNLSLSKFDSSPKNTRQLSIFCDLDRNLQAVDPLDFWHSSLPVPQCHLATKKEMLLATWFVKISRQLTLVNWKRQQRIFCVCDGTKKENFPFGFFFIHSILFLLFFCVIP